MESPMIPVRIGIGDTVYFAEKRYSFDQNYLRPHNFFALFFSIKKYH